MYDVHCIVYYLHCTVYTVHLYTEDEILTNSLDVGCSSLLLSDVVCPTLNAATTINTHIHLVPFISFIGFSCINEVGNKCAEFSRIITRALTDDGLNYSDRVMCKRNVYIPRWCALNRDRKLSDPSTYGVSRTLHLKQPHRPQSSSLYL